MVFSSLVFLYLFLPVYLIAYKLSKNIKQQNIVLLLFSIIFYAWSGPKFVLLLAAMSAVSWLTAIKIEKSSNRSKKIWLIISVVADIGCISFFKYLPLLCSIFGETPEFVKKIVLPIGISFYTFQLLTYVIDVYMGKAKAQSSYINVLLYAALFHQCIAGPIVRYNTISQELFIKRAPAELTEGVRRFSFGLAKKVLLANPCGEIADTIFAGNLESISVLSTWMGMLAFMFQIYLDFSAYSDMAIGLGKMIGLNYPENFNYPYISTSVTEFWRRWHMSLGTFFRDYVYIPLGGNRMGKKRQVFNLFVVWSLTGLWHGASWNFILWGLYFFIFLLLEKLFLKKYLDKNKFIAHIYLLTVVYFGWIIFHFTDFNDILTIFTNLFGGNGNVLAGFIPETMLKNNILLLIVSGIFATPLVKNGFEWMDEKLKDSLKLHNTWIFARDGILPVIFLLLSTAELVGASYNPFIYFQF